MKVLVFYDPRTFERAGKEKPAMQNPTDTIIRIANT